MSLTNGNSLNNFSDRKPGHKMRVIHVAHCAERYGIGTLLLSLIECQLNKFEDREVGVAFHTAGPCIERYKTLNVPVHVLGLKTAKDIRALTRFYKIFLQYDLINFHTYSPWAMLAGMMARKKMIFVFHGALGLRDQWLDFPKKMFYRFIINKYCDHLTFASNLALSRYLNNVGCTQDRNKFHVFPYGMKIDTIRPDTPRDEMRRSLGFDGQFVIGTAARMDPAKRIDRLIDAFAKLPREKNFLLVIMGSGDDQYEQSLKNRVADLGIADAVKFLGYRSDAYNVISALDFFVLPSDVEPFGLAILEAMALGVPSAAFVDAGGPVDILGDQGIVVKDVEELSQVIWQVSQDEVLKDRLGRQARQRAQEFDIYNMAKHLSDLYSGTESNKLV